MGKEIRDKLNEYNLKQASGIVKYRRRLSLGTKLAENYGCLMNLSDDKLGIRSTTIFGDDEVYNKIFYGKKNVLRAKFADELKKYIIEFLLKKGEEIEKRIMKEDEYHYLLNNSIEQIFEDKKREFYPRKSLIKKILGGKN